VSAVHRGGLGDARTPEDDDPAVMTSRDPGLTTMAQAVAAGRSRDSVQQDVETGRLDRHFRGVYAVPGSDDPLLLLRAACLHLGPTSVAVLGSATTVHGLQGAPRIPVPQVAVPPGLEKRQRSGLDLHFWNLPAGHREQVSGLTVTTVPRTLADCCRLLPRFAAVSLVDSALHQRRIDEDGLALVRAMMARHRNCVPGRLALAEARVGSQSPLETRVRLRAADGGCPPDALQVPVRDEAGTLLGYGDAGYALPGGGWLIVEADGRAVHEAPEALLHDRRRQNAFVSQPGVIVVRFTWADTRDASTIPQMLWPILRRHGWRP
jgi:hypothetical protein